MDSSANWNYWRVCLCGRDGLSLHQNKMFTAIELASGVVKVTKTAVTLHKSRRRGAPVNVADILKTKQAVLVVEKGKAIGIVTRQDVTEKS